jgi:hypothetical protein
MKAVRDRYCADVTAADEADRFLVAQNRPDRPSFAVPVVFVGQDKAQRKVSELSSLPRISLSQMLVRDCGTDSEQAEMTTSFGALRELDLSGNLFHSWSQLAGIVEHMPSLEELRANQSVFDESVDAAVLDQNQSEVAWIRQLKPSFSHLHTLYLHQVPRAFDYVWSLASSEAIPQLTHLSIAGIQLHAFPECVTPQKAAQRFPKLKHFDCSENPIGSWGELNRFASLLPSLTELVANHTHINVIDIDSDAQFVNLTFLSLNNGRVRHLNGLAALCALPTLHDFRFQRNPIAETIGTQATRQLVLALLPRLKVLNQSEIRPRERQDSEKHYIKVVHQELNAPVTATPTESISSAPAVASAFVPHVSSAVAAEAHAVPESAKAAAAAIAARMGAPAEADEPLEALERGAAHKRRRYDELVAVFGIFDLFSFLICISLVLKSIFVDRTSAGSRVSQQRRQQVRHGRIDVPHHGSQSDYTARHHEESAHVDDCVASQEFSVAFVQTAGGRHHPVLQGRRRRLARDVGQPQLGFERRFAVGR